MKYKNRKLPDRYKDKSQFVAWIEPGLHKKLKHYMNENDIGTNKEFLERVIGEL